MCCACVDVEAGRSRKFCKKVSLLLSSLVSFTPVLSSTTKCYLKKEKINTLTRKEQSDFLWIYVFVCSFLIVILCVTRRPNLSQRKRIQTENSQNEYLNTFKQNVGQRYKGKRKNMQEFQRWRKGDRNGGRDWESLVQWISKVAIRTAIKYFCSTVCLNVFGLIGPCFTNKQTANL